MSVMPSTTMQGTIPNCVHVPNLHYILLQVKNPKLAPPPPMQGFFVDRVPDGHLKRSLRGSNPERWRLCPHRVAIVTGSKGAP